jgi:hypothetical protein
VPKSAIYGNFTETSSALALQRTAALQSV